MVDFLLLQTPKLKFELVDVGGQRSERKKWIQCFDNVTAGSISKGNLLLNLPHLQSSSSSPWVTSTKCSTKTTPPTEWERVRNSLMRFSTLSSSRKPRSSSSSTRSTSSEKSWAATYWLIIYQTTGARTTLRQLCKIIILFHFEYAEMEQFSKFDHKIWKNIAIKNENIEQGQGRVFFAIYFTWHHRTQNFLVNHHLHTTEFYRTFFSEYIKRQYLKKNKNPNRDIYDFATTATDTDLVKNVFGVIQDIILSRMLESQGFEWTSDSGGQKHL